MAGCAHHVLPAGIAGLGRWLSGRAAGFNEVLLEFGNENWNALFRPAGIPDVASHGEAATRCFDQIKSEAGPLKLKLKTVVNAQSANPWYAAKTAGAAPSADILAVAHSSPLACDGTSYRGQEGGPVCAGTRRSSGTGASFARSAAGNRALRSQPAYGGWRRHARGAIFDSAQRGGRNRIGARNARVFCGPEPPGSVLMSWQAMMPGCHTGKVSWSCGG